MNLYVLGICGTFMGGLALLARSAGHRVTGCDQHVYPPMSELLARQGVEVRLGYDPHDIPDDVDLIIIGNALSRGNPVVEHVLDHGLAYASGPQWLGEHFLAGRRVLAVAGTHGKTTVASMLAWILEHSGRSPGFLIGGLPGNFDVSADAGSGADFVVEADEYDTAFFDKRSKFVHYRPQVAVLNNLELDHADIFPDLSAIQTQFHHLVRIIPGNGRIIAAAGDRALDEVLAMGVWTPVERFTLGDADADAQWRARALDAGGYRWEVSGAGQTSSMDWKIPGRHNLRNALAASAAAVAVGVPLSSATGALERFRLPSRRLEVLADHAGRVVVDDFAHHPTAIVATIAAARQRWPNRRLLVAFEPRSSSMRAGTHVDGLVPALAQADLAWVVAGQDLKWNPRQRLSHSRIQVIDSADDMVEILKQQAVGGDVVICMSNGAFGGAPRRLAEWVQGISS